MRVKIVPSKSDDYEDKYSCGACGCEYMDKSEAVVCCNLREF